MTNHQIRTALLKARNVSEVKIIIWLGQCDEYRWGMWLEVYAVDAYGKLMESIYVSDEYEQDDEVMERKLEKKQNTIYDYLIKNYDCVKETVTI